MPRASTEVLEGKCTNLWGGNPTAVNIAHCGLSSAMSNVHEYVCKYRGTEKVRYSLLAVAYFPSYLLIGEASSRQGVYSQAVVSRGVLRHGKKGIRGKNTSCSLLNIFLPSRKFKQHEFIPKWI